MRMEPYISPWFFYFAHIADGIKITTAAIGTLVLVFSTVYFLCELDSYESPFELLKEIKAVLIFGIFCVIIAILIPGSTIIYQMEIAKHMTPDNVNNIVQQVIEGARQVMEAIK